ncbi:hypothetical protein [Novipirellula artificiosorum]|nr:hypothetical protein [Novipirellula artificiosorum]
MNRFVNLTSMLLLLCCGVVHAQEAKQTDNKEQGPRKAKRYLETGGDRKLEVIYKKTPEGDMPLDLYYPTANRAAKCPVIIYTHGGGWAAGSKMGAGNASFAKTLDWKRQREMWHELQVTNPVAPETKTVA